MKQETQNIVIALVVGFIIFGGGGYAIGASQVSHQKELTSMAMQATAKAKSSESAAMKKEAEATAMQKKSEADAMKKDTSTTGDAMSADETTTATQ